jgi:hypothetical protein
LAGQEHVGGDPTFTPQHPNTQRISPDLFAHAAIDIRSARGFHAENLMSYDLSFASKRPLSRADVHGWLSKQPHAFPSDDRVGFENEVTGVYFGFDFYEDEALPAFNINYVRPHVFGLEAEPLLTAFVERFELEVDDPQSDGMGQGPYTPEGFLRGWNAGNRFGYRAVMSHESRPALKSLPRETNHMVWTWNIEREAIQELMELNPELPPAFAPSVFVVEDKNGIVFTLSVWTGDMPLLFAAGVDAFAIMTPSGNAIISRADVLALCKPVVQWKADQKDARGRRIGTPSTLIDQPSAAVLKQLQARATPRELTRLAIDQVLDRELLEEATKK